MGKGYLTSKSKSGLKLISKSKVKRFDYEGDPRNLCQLPREHKILAAVSADESKKHAKYLVVANLDNLCKYGDRFASRLLKKGLK